jgi:hypothetical protein
VNLRGQQAVVHQHAPAASMCVNQTIPDTATQRRDRKELATDGRLPAEVPR